MAGARIRLGFSTTINSRGPCIAGKFRKKAPGCCNADLPFYNYRVTLQSVHFAIRNLQIANYLCLMRKHNGMRPQDVVILLKMLTIGQENWQFKDIASGLELSPAEVSESLNRSLLAGLVDETRREVKRLSLAEFIQHGLHYVFPQAPGAMVNGVVTAHSHPYFRKQFHAEFKYVWPMASGEARGLAIEPLYAAQPAAALKDEKLYLLLACIDIVRVGRAREIKMAIDVLKQHLAA